MGAYIHRTHTWWGGADCPLPQNHFPILGPLETSRLQHRVSHLASPDFIPWRPYAPGACQYRPPAAVRVNVIVPESAALSN